MVERKGGDKNTGRREGVGGWERQVFGSKISLMLKSGDCIENRMGINDFWHAQRNCVDGLHAQRSLWLGCEETWTCGRVC